MAEHRPEKSTRADKTAQRRQLIVEAAAKLFILKGFHQTGMRDIAGEAGISLGNLYNHFNGKHEIIAAIAEIEASEMEPLLNLLDSVSADGSAALAEFAEAYFGICSSPEYAALSAEIVAEIFRNPEAGGAFLKTRARLIGALERHIPDVYSSRTATAGLVLDLIERAGQSAVGTTAKSRKEIGTSLLEMLTRVIGPS